MKTALTFVLFPIFVFLLYLKLYEAELNKAAEFVQPRDSRQSLSQSSESSCPEPIPPRPAPEGSWDDPDYQLGGKKTGLEVHTQFSPAIAEVPGKRIVFVQFGNEVFVNY